MSKESTGESKRYGLLVAVLISVFVFIVLLLEIDYDVLPVLDLPPWAFLRMAFIALIFIGLTWAILCVVGWIFESVAYPRVRSYAQVRSIWKLVSYAVWAAVLVVLLLALVGDVTSAAVSIGLIGAALAFALQKPILNIAGWMYITYNRMFRIGDRISMGGVKGYVLDIRLMHSEMMEMGEWMEGDVFTGRITLMPNWLVFEGPVQNYTKDSPFIWDEVVNLVTYESNIERAKDHMLKAAKHVVGGVMTDNFERYRRSLVIRDLDTELLREPKVRMNLQDSGVNLYVMYWCPAELRRKIKTQIVERIWHDFMKDPEIEIAYPHMEIVKHKYSWEIEGMDAALKKK